jgi:predicted Zn-dependent protease
LAGRVQEASDNGVLLTAMREAFTKRDFEGTLAAFRHLIEMIRVPRNMRLEATCLAARALIARKDRSGARALLKPLLAENDTNPIHYDFLAHAFLDLRNYREAARLCDRAAALVDAQAQR